MEETTKQARVGAEREPLLQQARRVVEQQRADQMEHFSFKELHTLKDLFGERMAAMVTLMQLVGKDPSQTTMNVAFTMALIGVEVGYALAKDDMANLTHGPRERRPR